MNHPSIFAFTDCKDSNALSRLSARLTALFADSNIQTVGIDKDIEAAGCILDMLDALRLGTGDYIIIGNLAPRAEKQYKNGAPFYIAHVQGIIIIATKTCFSLLRKLNLIDTIGQTDVETVCGTFLSAEETNRIANSQFRSFEYVPLLASFAADGKDIPATAEALDSFSPEKFENKIWWIDNFGNAKTTLTRTEIEDKVIGGNVTLRIDGTEHTLPFFERMADVPTGVVACIIGSSGYKDVRFAEIIKQGSSVAQALGLGVGNMIL
jgi:hypothetical protein